MLAPFMLHNFFRRFSLKTFFKGIRKVRNIEVWRRIRHNQAHKECHKNPRNMRNIRFASQLFITRKREFWPVETVPLISFIKGSHAGYSQSSMERLQVANRRIIADRRRPLPLWDAVGARGWTSYFYWCSTCLLYLRGRIYAYKRGRVLVYADVFYELIR